MKKLSPHEEEVAKLTIHDLNKFTDHCFRSQETIKDIKKNMGPLSKLLKYLLGSPDRFSSTLPLCHECYELTCHLVTGAEVNTPLSRFVEDFREIQHNCQLEQCGEAYNRALKAKKEIQDHFF